MNTITVGLTTKSPLHIADAFEGQGAQKLLNEKTLKFAQTTKLKMPIKRANKDKTELEINMDGVPVINGNLLRGRIRRNIADRILSSLRDRGEMISVDFLHLITSLATSASPSAAKNLHNAMKSDNTLKFLSDKVAAKTGEVDANSGIRREHLELQTSDPFAALFGGGPNLWPSRLVTPGFLPNIISLVEPHFVNGDLAQKFKATPLNILPYYLTQVIGGIRTDNLGENLAYFDADNKEVAAWMAVDSHSRDKSDQTVDENGNKVKKEKESKANLRNMMPVEVVAPGIPFIGSIKVADNDVDKKMHDIMTGLILLGIKDISNKSIGGMVRNGWGEMSVDIVEGDNAKMEKAALSYIENIKPMSVMEAYGVAFR